MRVKLCWICGQPVAQSAVGKLGQPGPVFHLEVRIVNVNRPYATNFRTNPVYVCDGCSVEKLGLTGSGENLNKDRG